MTALILASPAPRSRPPVRAARTHSPLSDAELVALHRQGHGLPPDRHPHPDARNLLLDRHYGLCVHAVQKVTPPPHIDPDDLLQDALLALFQVFDSPPPPLGKGWDADRLPPVKLATYATRAVRWAVLQGLTRRAGRFPADGACHPTDLDGLPHAGEVPPDGSLDRLTPLERAVVELSACEVREGEVADRLGLTVGRVRAVLRAAREKLLGGE